MRDSVARELVIAVGRFSQALEALTLLTTELLKQDESSRLEPMKAVRRPEQTSETAVKLDRDQRSLPF